MSDEATDSAPNNAHCPQCNSGSDAYKLFHLDGKVVHSCGHCGHKDYESAAQNWLQQPISEEVFTRSRDELLSLALQYLPPTPIRVWVVATWVTTTEQAFAIFNVSRLLTGIVRHHIGLVGATDNEFFVADYGVVTETPDLPALRSLLKAQKPNVATFPIAKLSACCTNYTDKATVGTLWVHGMLEREFSITNTHRLNNIPEAANVGAALNRTLLSAAKTTAETPVRSQTTARPEKEQFGNKTQKDLAIDPHAVPFGPPAQTARVPGRGCLIAGAIVLFNLVLMIWMGSTEWCLWANASRNDTPESYTDYINRFPNGRHRPEAQARLSRLDAVKRRIDAVRLSRKARTIQDNPRAKETTPYIDKNRYFQFAPPEGWVKKEFADPRTKVSFDVPSPIPGQNRAGLFFLSHPLSGEVNVREESEDKVARLKQMGSPDARVTSVDFAGVKAEQVDGQMGRQNVYLKVLMFTNHGRSYAISFTATKQDFAQFWPVAETALKTFKCIPPEGVEVATDKDAVQKEKIRVWITALKETDMGTDAFNSLLAIGLPAIPQLEDAERAGTPLQKQRAADLLERIRSVGK